jgi:hypothetical protein
MAGDSKVRSDRSQLRLIGFISMGLVLLLWVGYSAFHLPFIAVYHYESSDGGFEDEEVPAKGRQLSSIETYFVQYRAKKGDPTLKLYRLDDRDWTNLLRYPDYLWNRRWKLPRKSVRT